MDKHWIVYSISTDGTPNCVKRLGTREAADQDAVYRANQWPRSAPYFVAEVVARTQLVERPTNVIERV